MSGKGRKNQGKRRLKKGKGNGAKPLPEKPGTPSKTRGKNSDDKTPFINEDIDIVKDELHLLDDIKIKPEDVSVSSLSHPDPEATNTNPGAVINVPGTLVKKEEELDPGQSTDIAQVNEKELLENNSQDIREHTEVETERAEHIVLRFEINNVVTSILDVVDLERMLDGDKKSRGRQRKPRRLSTARPKYGVDKNDGCLYKCKYCAKLFAVKNVYINHLKRMHQRVESVQVDGKTVCSSDESRTECLPASPSSERRRQHICRLCNKHFRSPYDLTRHVRVHNGERPFQCNICQKRFTQRSNLDSHAQRHAGNKPHVCSVCDKAFAVKANMISHTRTHTGQRPYKCTECPKAFTQQSSLVIHIRTHTGVKPYVCPECNAAFTHNGNLTRHIRTKCKIRVETRTSVPSAAARSLEPTA